MTLPEIEVRALDPKRLEPLIGVERAAHFASVADAARTRLAGRRVLNVNSTATGGGVAELLQTLLAYARGADVDARWTVIEGTPRFFQITKRIHNHLYGSRGDGGPLGDAERRDYERVLQQNAPGVLAHVRAGDFVLLHDPQTAGLTDALRAAGTRVVWRCHVGVDTPNAASRAGWSFLRPYIEAADAFVFSRGQFAPDWVPKDRLFVIPPSIDPFSAKNEPIEPDQVTAVLTYVGLLAGVASEPLHSFTRRDGDRGRIQRPVDLVAGGPVPPDVPVVLQASRWDAMKDMRGVMCAFADHVVDTTDAHLVLAGPECSRVADDPEAHAVLDECVDTWHKLSEATRRRIHLVCMPMSDPDEAAAVVNALQRHAAVVTQKSIAEGFGLTVAEAMFKARPVVASAVGGIVDQVVDGTTGRLIADPCDLAAFGVAVRSLLDDPVSAERMGANGRARVVEHFLGDRHLEHWAELLLALMH